MLVPSVYQVLLRLLVVGVPVVLVVLVACRTAPTVTERPHPRSAELLAAIEGGDRAQVERLVAEGVPLDAADSTGWTPLTYAALQGTPGVVALLLKAGAGVEQRTNGVYESTALMAAAAADARETAEVLIAAGADVDAVDAYGDSALNWAAYYGHAAFAELLLGHGADAHQPSEHGVNTMAVALKEWRPGVVEVLIAAGEGVALSAPAKVLVEAVRGNDPVAIGRHLQAGADPNQRDEAGTPLLVLAAERGSEGSIDRLLTAGADPDARNAVGQTALTQAAYYGHASLVDRLLAAGTDVNRTDDRFRLTPLMAAARAGHAGLVPTLLAAGAHLEAEDGINGFTPLLWATVHEQVDVVKALLAAGAAADHVSAYDVTAADLARDSVRMVLDAYSGEG